MRLASRWPRGRYNGRRITGFTVRLRVDVACWRWLPGFEWGCGQPMLNWLCFAMLAQAEYHYLD